MQTITIKLPKNGEYPYFVKEIDGNSVWMVTGDANEFGRHPAEFIGSGHSDDEHPFHWKDALTMKYYERLDRIRLMIIIGNR